MFALRQVALFKGLVLAAGLAAAAPVAAADFTCGDRIVTTGMTAGQVVAACGKPSEVRVNPPVRRRHGYGRDSFDEIIEPGGEVWIYNFGSTKLLQKLLFVGGVLAETTTLLSYGYDN
jgi:Protein of unknown function (DUF2845)